MKDTILGKYPCENFQFDFHLFVLWIFLAETITNEFELIQALV